MNSYVINWEGKLVKPESHQKYDIRCKIEFDDLIEVIVKLQSKVQELEEKLDEVDKNCR